MRALVSCGTCRIACFARTQQGHGYYCCRDKQSDVPSPERCLARYIPAAQLDELVWQDLCGVLSHPELIVQALQRAQAGHWLPQALQARREGLRKARTTLQGQLERLTEAYLAQVLSLEEYKRRRQDLEQRLQAIENQWRQLEVSATHHAELAGAVRSLTEFCQQVARGLAQATFEQKRQLVELLIDRVIASDTEVEIRYVIPPLPPASISVFVNCLRTISDAM